MSTISIEKLGEGAMYQIKVHPTDLIPLRRHLSKMINEEIMRKAREMDALGGVDVGKIAEIYHCTFQYVYYVLHKNGVKIHRQSRISHGQES